MLKNFLRVSTPITFVTGFFVFFSSSQICGSDFKDSCMDKRKAAVNLQLDMHELCNDILGKPVANSNDAIKQVKSLLIDSGNTDLLPDIRELQTINREGNKAKHDWTQGYCSLAGGSLSQNQAREIRSSAAIAESQTRGTLHTEQRWAPMPAARNTRYGGVGQDLSHLGSAVMGPPPPTPYEQALFRANRGIATSYDFEQLGIGAPLPPMFPAASTSKEIEKSNIQAIREGRNTLWLEQAKSAQESGRRLTSTEETILEAEKEYKQGEKKIQLCWKDERCIDTSCPFRHTWR